MSDAPAQPEPTTTAEFAERLSARTAAMSTRMLADRSGWSRSTISELRGGQRLPTAQQLADLLGAASASDAEIAEWERWRHGLRQPVPVIPAGTADDAARPVPEDGETESSSETPSQPDGRTVRRRGVRRVLIWSAALAAAAAAGFAVGRVTAAPAGAIAPTPAVVANTANLGVMTYTGPSRRERAPGTLPEGSRIMIVCQVGDGEPLTDRVDGTVLTWPVWDKLDDGRWVPDLYTSLNKDYRPGRTATALLTC